MKREIESQLFKWKTRIGRKPLVLMGARQVGKTWLMRDFGKRNFAQVHEFNFDDNPDLSLVFEHSKDPKDILPQLAILSGRKIDIAHDLVVFDEIQNCGNALNALKYFYEKCPELAVVSAGSLLGVQIRQKGRTEGCFKEWPQSYPVGKVELLDVEPLSFSEFLAARNEGLWEFYQSVCGHDPIPEVLHNELWRQYLVYLTVGGMPEVVSSYIEEGDPARVCQLQRDLVTLYENDIVKYNGELDAAKILLVMRSVVPQLAKENGKFVYGVLREGARARGYEDAIEWLVSARMVRRIHNLEKIEYPLAAQTIRTAFKLYFNDIGLLRSVAAINGESLILNKDFPFKGRYAENFVLQQLSGRTEGDIHYWSERAESEIDFVIQHEGETIPVEVKAGLDRKSASFKTFVNRRKPRFAIRFSERNLRKDGGFVNIPLYLAPRFASCL